MDFFDFMFPEQAEASHLRAISSQLRASAVAQNRRVRAASRTASGTTAEVEALREDVRFLSMIVLSMVKRLSEDERLSVADLADLFGEIDALDGVADGGLDVNVLRGALGAVRASEAAPEEDAAPAAPVPGRGRLRRFRRR